MYVLLMLEGTCLLRIAQQGGVYACLQRKEKSLGLPAAVEEICKVHIFNDAENCWLRNGPLKAAELAKQVLAEICSATGCTQVL